MSLRSLQYSQKEELLVIELKDHTDQGVLSARTKIMKMKYRDESKNRKTILCHNSGMGCHGTTASTRVIGNELSFPLKGSDTQGREC